MGKPVVASRLPMVERTFRPGSITVYEPGDPDALAGAILAILDDSAARDAAVGAMAARVDELAWEREADRLVALIDRLATDRLSSPT